MLKNFLSDIGKLDRIIFIRKETILEKDLYGHVSEKRVDDAKVNAAYFFNSKEERTDLAKQTQFDYTKFIIRFFSGLKLEDKVVYENIEYDIINIEPIGRNRFQKITLKAVI